jgi:hypothetical protein
MDEHLVLEGAPHAVGVAEVVDRGPAGGDARRQGVDDGVAKGGDLLASQGTDRPQGVDAGAEQRLVGVDVPHAGELRLVEQERLDRRAPPACERAQTLGGELGPQGLDAQAGGEEGVPRLGAQGELARAEPARVAERQAPPTGQREAHACVGRPRLGRVPEQGPRHAQVQEQERVALGLPHEVLPAPREPSDGAALERLGEPFGRERAAPTLVVDLQALEHPPLDEGCELAADRLDLGEFRHGSQARPGTGGQAARARGCARW